MTLRIDIFWTEGFETVVGIYVILMTTHNMSILEYISYMIIYFYV